MWSNCVYVQKRAVGVCCGKRFRVIKVFTTATAFFLVTCSYQLLQGGNLQNTKHVVQKQSTLISNDFGQSQSRQRLLSPVDRLVADYSVDFSYPLDPGQSPWQLAESWVTVQELYPQRAPQLGQHNDSGTSLVCVSCLHSALYAKENRTEHASWPEM